MSHREFLYRIQPVRADMLESGPTPEEDAVVSAHFDYLRELRDRGVLILAGRTLNTDAGAFGIVVFEADDEVSARAIVAADPAVSKGVMRADLFPHRVALMTGRA